MCQNMGICLFKVNNRNTKARCETCLELDSFNIFGHFFIDKCMKFQKMSMKKYKNFKNNYLSGLVSMNIFTDPF